MAVDDDEAYGDTLESSRCADDCELLDSDYGYLSDDCKFIGDDSGFVDDRCGPPSRSVCRSFTEDECAHPMGFDVRNCYK